MDTGRGADNPASPLSGEALMAALTASAGAGVYAVDADGHVIACNPAAERLLGHAPGALTGVDARAVLGPGAAGATGDTGWGPADAPPQRPGADRAVLLRADGTALTVWRSVAPLPPGAGRGPGSVVVFHDISAQRAGADRRAERYARSETKREQAEYDLAEITWLSELTLAMVSTLDADEALGRLVRLLVPRLADTAVIDLVEGRVPRRTAWAHQVPGVLPADPAGPSEVPEHPAHRAALAGVRQGAGMRNVGLSGADAPAHGDLLGLVDAAHALVVPLRLRATTLGTLTLARSADGPPFDEGDRVLADEVARRTALGLENTRLHAAQADIAATLQRALLTDLPTVPGLELAAHYRPAQRTAEVGGDWYDAFPLPGGDVALVVGDVTGHDIQAASRMGELRSMLRALAVDRPEEDPGRILRRLDTAQSRLTLADSATLVLARLHPLPGGCWELSWSVAGHPPPLLLGPEPAAAYLDGAHAMLLGVRPTAQRPTARTTLPAGATLLLYTDGLVESRVQSIDTGMTRLRRHAVAHRDLSLPRLCARLARDLGDVRDDITLIAARLQAPPRGGRRPG
ncbi:SpoIIE family protein phosphatase [Streptomyces tremellae]|uniref:SpoIIE family protein phosphatase n=1 Tax=Streptomyces tremellae TaxID=1124239 RepID=A0ABP7EX51_9ACTN